MNKEEIAHKIKCKKGKRILTDEIHRLQKCEGGKIKVIR